jgi:lipopolysaccharide transport system ATP-binding protein
MASISVEDVTIDLPIIGYNGRSIRRFIVNMSTGGRTRKQGDELVIVRAVDKVSFDLKSGDRLGIYGHNGSGKTTLLRALAGIYSPTKGSIKVEGSIASLLDTNFGLNFDATGRENIYLLLTYRGFHHKDIAKLQPAIEEWTELGTFIDLPVRTYSSGMLARLGFAVATSYQPDVLLMDEWLSTGDENFIKKATTRVSNFVDSANVLVLASHSRGLIKDMCNKLIILQKGQVILQGSPAATFKELDRLNDEKLKAESTPELKIA